MDERIFKFKPGEPIPEWDLRHRLPIGQPVGPVCKDTATIFRINSTYMDVSDQPYMARQMLAFAVFLSFMLAVVFLIPIIIVMVRHDENVSGELIFLWVTSIVGIAFCACFTFWAGRDEYFSLKRRPIRFNREVQKIFAIRRRRFFARPGEGDVTWEVPWNSKSIFCIHKSDAAVDNAYHIRHYEVDAHGNVIRAFAIGRQWEGKANIEGLLSQWNYWCEYMNEGPSRLPAPALFFKEQESAQESFLFCMYQLGMGASVSSRIMMMPFILIETTFRLLAQWTCRDPQFPLSVTAASSIDSHDPFDQPSGETPVGWGETAIAREANKWPFDPKKMVSSLKGEQDPEKNAWQWSGETPAFQIAEDFPPGRPTFH